MIKENRDILVRVLLILLIAYSFLKIYKLSNPYAFPYLEERMEYTIIALSIATALLYVPYGKFKSKLVKLEKIVINKILPLSLGQKFVLSAIIFLIAAAFILAYGDEAEANKTAILAYYLLVLGVFNLVAEYAMGSENCYDPHPKPRAFASLLALSLLIYFTSEITKKYPYLYLVPIILAFLAFIFMLLARPTRKLRYARRGGHFIIMS